MRVRERGGARYTRVEKPLVYCVSITQSERNCVCVCVCVCVRERERERERENDGAIAAASSDDVVTIDCEYML